MSSRDKEVLAQAAAARLTGAACAGQGETWDLQEQMHAVAGSQAKAWAAAEPLVAICARCPIVAECCEWALVDEYTGIAAGAAWVNGVEKPAHWIHRHPMKKLAS